MAQRDEPSLFSSFVSSLWSSTTIRADEGKDEDESGDADASDDKSGDDSDGGDAATDDAGGDDAGADEEEEEEVRRSHDVVLVMLTFIQEPEDPMPGLRDECENGPCAKYKHHFEECEKRVADGKGFKGEDCTEELFHMLHCIDNCSANKVFAATR